MNRIQIHRRRFAWKVGDTFLGVWELMPVSPILRLMDHRKRRLSFAIPRPDAIDRKQIRALILQKMGALTKEREDGQTIAS